VFACLETQTVIALWAVRTEAESPRWWHFSEIEINILYCCHNGAKIHISFQFQLFMPVSFQFFYVPRHDVRLYQRDKHLAHGIHWATSP
jgi:hypothetical protein